LVCGNVAEQERLHKQLVEKSADLDQKVKELKLLKLKLLEFKGTMEAFIKNQFARAIIAISDGGMWISDFHKILIIRIL
jgi:hypothetical protein